MTSSREAWERVLAAVEADALRAEALLHAPLASFETQESNDDPELVSVDGIPADWNLPMAINLPTFDTMPPVPPELSDRILALRSQITDLQAELMTAMQAIPRQQPRRVAAVASADSPAFIDRRL